MAKGVGAKAFYGVLAVSTLMGLMVNFTKLDAIKTLVWAAIINAVTAAPAMCFMMRMASNRKIIGKLHLPVYLKAVGWAATGITVLAAIGLFLTSAK
jgi:Mn2+/Fe2+ NRAMP family transporter